MDTLVTVLFLAVAAANLLPMFGAASRERLQILYGVTLEDPNLVILMRHRAILLGIVGALLAAAAFQPPLRPAAILAGLVSMLSFVLIARLVGEANSQLRRVARVDIVASAVLLIAAALHWA